MNKLQVLLISHSGSLVAETSIKPNIQTRKTDSQMTAGGRRQLGQRRQEIATREADRMADVAASILNFFFFGACGRFGAAL